MKKNRRNVDDYLMIEGRKIFNSNKVIHSELLCQAFTQSSYQSDGANTALYFRTRSILIVLAYNVCSVLYDHCDVNHQELPELQLNVCIQQLGILLNIFLFLMRDYLQPKRTADGRLTFGYMLVPLNQGYKCIFF